MSESHLNAPMRGRHVRVAMSWVAGGAAIMAYLTLVSFHTVGGNSDGATVVLEGSSLAHGNLLLHGWILSQDSFWTVDALFYGLFDLLFGINGAFLHLVPAFIATITVGVAALIATSQNPGASRRVALAVVILGLVFPVSAWAEFYLAGPYHVGTTLFCLLAFWLVTQRRSTFGLMAAAALLCLGTLGDLQTISLGVIPLAIAGVVAMARTWTLRAGRDALIVAATGAGSAFAIRDLVELIGGFTNATPRVAATLSQALANVPPGLHLGMNLLGVGTGPFPKSPIPPEWDFAHLAILVAVVGCLLVAMYQLGRGVLLEEPPLDSPPWHLDDLLLIGAIGSLATYAYLVVIASPAEARYLSAAVIFAITLTARVVARIPDRVDSRVRRPTGALFGCVVVATMIGGGYTAAATPPPQAVNNLIATLRAHRLTYGLGGYWSASITTVESNNAIRVRPIISGPNGRVVRYARQSLATWYTHGHPDFLVYNKDVNIDAVTTQSALATFGRPRYAYTVGPFQVLVYAHPIDVGTIGADT